MEKHIPLISTRSVGPLGLVHLPRLWLKLRLAAKGMLADDYHAGEGSADQGLLKTLGLSLDKVATFIADNQPSYVAFESWVRENAPQENLTPEAIEAFNTRILSVPKPEPERSEMLARAGFPQDDTVWLAIDLNDQDDWHGFHEALLDEK